MNATQMKGLSAKQMNAIELMAIKRLSKAETAAAISVSERTINNWFSKNIEFSTAFQETKENLTLNDERKQKYRNISEKAIDRLCALMECGDPKTELAAAKEILSRLIECSNDEDTEEVEFQPGSGDGLMEAILAAMRKD